MAGTKNNPIKRKQNTTRSFDRLETDNINNFMRWAGEAYMEGFYSLGFDNMQLTAITHAEQGKERAAGEQRRVLEINFYELVKDRTVETAYKYSYISDPQEPDETYIPDVLRNIGNGLVEILGRNVEYNVNGFKLYLTQKAKAR